MCLSDYQNPVPLDTLEFQIGLAVNEASDLEFVPLALSKYYIGAEHHTRNIHNTISATP